jgi:DNA-binding NtrC family response regulator
MIRLKLILNQDHYALSDIQISSTLSMDALRKFFDSKRESEGNTSMSTVSILVVEDDEGLQNLLRRLFSQAGHVATIVGSGLEAIRVAKENPVHVLMTDLKLPDIDGLAVLERIHQIDPKVIGIVMTGYGSIDCAVKAMKAGAFDFLTKPFDNEVFTVTINRALEAYRRRQSTLSSRKSVRDRFQMEQFVGSSEPIRQVLEFVTKVADHGSTVLIQGESGTGKELVARMLHFNSARKDRPLIPVNCGAIPENLLESELFGHEKGAFTGAVHTRIGRFESAHGGTIFLDEIGELSLGLQVKLLRVLQERSFERVGGTKTIDVDVRVVAATNQDLEEAVRQKRFREDLYYRLNVIPVTIPPLRERRSDIPQLVNHFLTKLNHDKPTTMTDCSPDAMARLMEYHWPGNIRELENMVERVAVLSRSGTIEASDLPERIRRSPVTVEQPAAHFVSFSDQGVNLSQEIEQLENRLIVDALRQAKGITSKAAQLLQVNRTTLIEKMKRKGFASKAQGLRVSEQFSVA